MPPVTATDTPIQLLPLSDRPPLLLSLDEWCVVHVLLEHTLSASSLQLWRLSLGLGELSPRDCQRAALRLQKALDEHPQSRTVCLAPGGPRFLSARLQPRLFVCLRRDRLAAVADFLQAAGGLRLA